MTVRAHLLEQTLGELTAACLPEIRLAPDAGEILESFGLSGERFARPDQPASWNNPRGR